MSATTEPARLTQEEFDEFLQVRDMGGCNMFDRGGVLGQAVEAGLDNIAGWIAENKADYGKLVFGNYEIVED